MTIFNHPLRERGEQMILDLESWEAGYDDGLLGRPSQCASSLDRFSYSSGYFQEEQILTAHGVSIEQKEKLLELKDFSLFREFSEEELSNIKECVSEVSLKREKRLFSTGDSGDEMFLVRRGGVRILLPVAGNYRQLLMHLFEQAYGGVIDRTDSPH